jgi:hypothetical protein
MRVLLFFGTVLLVWAIPGCSQVGTPTQPSSDLQTSPASGLATSPGPTMSPTTNCQSVIRVPGYLPPVVPTSNELNAHSQLPSARSGGTPASITQAPPSSVTPPPFPSLGSSTGATSGIGYIGPSGIGVPSAAPSPPPSSVPLTPMPAVGSSTSATNAYITPPAVMLPRPCS